MIPIMFRQKGIAPLVRVAWNDPGLIKKAYDGGAVSVMVPQVGAMFKGDRSRKNMLVDYGFRLPCARDNRPLMFEEWEQKVNQAIYLSATPRDYELEHSEGLIVELFG